MDIKKLLNHINHFNGALIIALALLMPVFFLPFTTEFFEFNKLVLLVIATSVLVIAWAVKVVLSGRFVILRSPLDMVTILGLIILGFSTYFSLDVTSSLFGTQGRWFPSVLSLVTLAVFYYAFTSNTRKDSTNLILNFLLIGIGVNTVTTLLSYFGVLALVGKSVPFLQTTSFTLTGSPLTTVILSAIAAMFSTVYLLNTKEVKTKIIYAVSALLNILAVELIGYTTGVTMLLAGLVLVGITATSKKLQENKLYIGAILGVLVITAALLLTPVTSRYIVNPAFPQENGLSLITSWIVSTSTIRDFPILGTGPSTYYLNYPRYKPAQVNQTTAWDVNFDKASNEVLNTMGTMGVLGLVVLIIFVLKVIKIVLHKQKDMNIEVRALNLGIAMMLLSLLVTYSTVLTAFVFVLLLGLRLINSNPEGNEGLSKYEVVGVTVATAETQSNKPAGGIIHYVIMLPLVGLTITGLVFTYMNYAAEYNIRMSIQAAQRNDGANTYEYQARAIKMNPKRDTYRTLFALTNLELARSIATKSDITDQDRKNFQILIAQAVDNSKLATDVLNPLNPVNWNTRGQVYKSIIGIAEGAENFALDSYNTALSLDPNNPKLRLELGGVYYAQQDYLKAGSMYRQAVNMKPDYANARYNFAQALIKLENYQDAALVLQSVQSLLPVDSTDYQRVGAEIIALGELTPKVAGTNAQQTAIPTPEPPVDKNQQPLSNPEEVTIPQVTQ